MTDEEMKALLDHTYERVERIVLANAHGMSAHKQEVVIRSLRNFASA